MAINLPKETVQEDVQETVQEDAFEKMRKVIELARRLAVEDYHRHVLSIKNATTSEETRDALTQLQASNVAFMKIDVAYKSLISAESDFRGTTVNLLQGDHEKAKEQALNSSAHLGDVAENLKAYGETIPQSKFFASALTAITNADRIIGKVEDNISMTVERFSAGLDNFANRVNEIKDDVAKFPSVVIDKVKSTGESMFAAIKSAGSKLMERFQAGDSRNVFTEKEVTDGAAQVVRTGEFSNSSKVLNKAALKVIDQLSNGFISKNPSLINAISDHIATIGSYGQDALEYAESKIRKISESYAERLAQTRSSSEIGTHGNPVPIDPAQVSKAIDTFFDIKDATPRQILYSRLISEFLVEADPEKKNQYLKTMKRLEDQTDQSSTEKQNASDSWKYMILAFTNPLPPGAKNATSNDVLDLHRAMIMLNEIERASFRDAMKMQEPEEIKNNPFPSFDDVISRNQSIRNPYLDINHDLEMDKWHEEIKNKSLRDGVFETDPVFDLDPSSMETLEKIVVSHPHPESPSMQEELAKSHMEAPTESISDFKNRIRENLNNHNNQENSAPRDRG